ncbi:lytic transglycosylase domain-containing protein [Pseudohoeflea sp. DP4N28-3]|uniref:Lytic transglycosylase domain-containing protein n=2 Tax=Pseudohoeflea coraliihabitans TaxID=2860393 RepID=A0ABS6WPR0_9HYPH|nr:lytic transglycosylase domain-containing protein [Pseudohoeflea sp. DP4N28-3]
MVLLAAPQPVHAQGAAADRTSAEQICALIGSEARRNGLPESFFARLIWKESRFDTGAVSPAGAEGIAQFMPATARLRGLSDSFDIAQALPASARYLAELKNRFGNLGLAAAAYNAGERRVERWLTSGGFLPLETEDYVRDITGEAADTFADRARRIRLRPLDAKLSFDEACRALPVIMTRTTPMAEVSRKPWAVLVAGHFDRAVALKQWQRMRQATGVTVASEDVYVSRKRTGMARSGVHSVRIGVQTRGRAEAICSELRAKGGACVVLKNS